MTTKTRNTKPVAVAGGGIGGLATALGLAQRGFRVTVLEQARQFGEVGVGLQVAPNALAVLDALGVGAMETVFWRAIVVPKGTPADIVAKLEQSFLKASQHPKFLDYLAGLGEVPAGVRGAALAREIRAEYDALGVLTKQVAPK